MRSRSLGAAVALFACCSLSTLAYFPAAYLEPSSAATGQQGNTPASPAATATVKLKGQELSIQYSAPSVRGRKIMGGVVPYGKPWRTGANPATSFTTAAHLKIGNLDVPAGSYTIYTLPSQDSWMMIINKQTGQWGTVYNEDQDLGRTAMTINPLAAPQEVMSISFENTHADTTELHIKWEKTDAFVTVKAQ